MGQRVRLLEQGFRAQGVHQIEWNGRDDNGRPHPLPHRPGRTWRIWHALPAFLFKP